MKKYIRSGVMNDHSNASSLSSGDEFIDVESGERYKVKSVNRGRDGQYIFETDKGTLTLDPADPVDIVGCNSIKASSDPREATDYLLQCLEDGVIGCEYVVLEFCKYVSDDDVREINEALGLYDI